MAFRAGSWGLRVRTVAACAVSCGGLAVAGSGCATTGLEGGVYRGEGFALQVPERPAGWAAIDVSDAALAYRDDASAGTVLVNGRCDKDGDDVPLSSLTQHLFMRFTEREITLEETVPFDGREALHTVITAKLDGVTKRFSTWVIKKDGCVYDLVYVADPDRFAAGAPRFDAFATRVHLLPRDGDPGP